ncbi:MAG: hypothetical protein AB8B67_01685 [Rickettsiaceae bacterium]
METLKDTTSTMNLDSSDEDIMNSMNNQNLHQDGENLHHNTEVLGSDVMFGCAIF